MHGLHASAFPSIDTALKYGCDVIAPFFLACAGGKSTEKTSVAYHFVI